MFQYICYGYFVLVNIISFVVFGIDKYKAKKEEWRIQEKVLILLVGIGGGIGSILGMIVFRHKIRKPLFYLGIPGILIFQMLCICLGKL